MPCKHPRKTLQAPRSELSSRWRGWERNQHPARLGLPLPQHRHRLGPGKLILLIPDFFLLRLEVPTVKRLGRGWIEAAGEDRRHDPEEGAEEVVFPGHTRLPRKDGQEHAAEQKEGDERHRHRQPVAAQQTESEQEKHQPMGDAARPKMDGIARKSQTPKPLPSQISGKAIRSARG